MVYADEDMAVIAKPSGLLSVPGRPQDHEDCAESRVRALWPRARAVHRLDMATSGLLVFALNPTALRRLNAQFAARSVQKTYIARVWGRVEAEEGQVDAPLICDWVNRPLQKVDFDNGKPALTRWRVLDREGEVTRLRLSPVTGRSHQLRVHMQYIGHPIMGDEFYGAAEDRTGRLHLHAQSLTLTHPLHGSVMVFTEEAAF